MVNNILLVGVGGQGTILASKLLTLGLMAAGHDVKMSEIHGMSQRGGSVSSQVRYGDVVHSPVIEEGSADIIVAFEKLEAARWLPYLKEGGKMLINNHEIESVPVLSGKMNYPENLIDKISNLVQTVSVDAIEHAMEIGNVKVMNMVLLGMIIKSMSLERIDWQSILEENVKPNLVAMNLMAIEKGKSLV